MEEKDIVEQVLLKLDGWVLDTTVEADNLTSMEYNKCITREEILNWYETACDYATSYLLEADTSKIAVYDTAVVMWTAGLIWSKYNQNINSQLDETNPNPFGYGDKLVIQAKEILKPYKSYSFYAY